MTILAYHDYKEELSSSSTTSTSWQNKLTKAMTNMPAGDYEVSASFLTQVSSGQTEVRVQLNDTTDLMPATVYWGDNATTSSGAWVTSGFIKKATMSAGTNTIDVDYQQASSGTAYIKEVRLSVKQIFK